MTLRDLLQDVARRCDKNVTQGVDPETRQRLITFLNDRYREVMRMPGVIQTRDESFTFTTQANRTRYALPVAASSVVTIVDQVNRMVLKPRSLAWIRNNDPSIPSQAKGTPLVYVLLNFGGPEQQYDTVAGGALDVVSSSALDTDVVYIEWHDTDGGFRVSTATLNGLTPVTVTLTGLKGVFRMSYTATAVGKISLRQVAGSIPLIVLPPTTLTSYTGNPHASRNQIIHLWPTPGGVFTYTVDAARPVAPLVNDLDEPAFTDEFHTLLVWGACMDEMIKMDDNRRQSYEGLWRRDLGALNAYLHQIRGTRLIPSGERGERPRWSPLGSNYPAWYE